MIIISIHALREEGDDLPGVLPDEDKKFLSTPSARRATAEVIPAARTFLISIHALREEGDAASPGAARTTENFYPRPPRGGRHDLYAPFGPGEVFLSTPSARRATHRGQREQRL